jgi:hypothetical protein
LEELTDLAQDRIRDDDVDDDDDDDDDDIYLFMLLTSFDFHPPIISAQTL